MMCEEMIFEYWFSTIRKLSEEKSICSENS